MSTTATDTVLVDGIGPVEVSIAEYGSGQPFLLLHGGAGPASVTGFAELFAATHDVRVLVPTHPGFGGTPRPEALHSIPALAALYNTLLDRLDLADVTVMGNSIGGWITAEIGRQPWLVYQLMRTADGYSKTVSAGNGMFTLLGFMGMYTVLGILFLFLMHREIAHGPADASPPQKPTPVEAAAS